MKYVTFDDAGNLTGAFDQERPAVHAATSIEVSLEVLADWTAYRATADRMGVELIPAAAKVAQLRASLWERIKAERDRRKATGGYLAAGKWFHSDDSSRIQQLALFVMGAAVPAVQWKTMDGSFVTMSQTLAAQVFAAAAAADQALFTHAEVLRAAVNAAADPAAVDITAGWPATFGG